MTVPFGAAERQAKQGESVIDGLGVATPGGSSRSARPLSDRSCPGAYRVGQLGRGRLIKGHLMRVCARDTPRIYLLPTSIPEPLPPRISGTATALKSLHCLDSYPAACARSARECAGAASWSALSATSRPIGPTKRGPFSGVP